jgi:hypothetical protein
VSRKNFTSINTADEALICGFVTWLFLPIPLEYFVHRIFEGDAELRNMKSGEQRGRKKMGVQIRILDRVLKRAILSRKNRTSILDMFGNRQVK